ncbi:MAG: D-amino-acid transaminase [Bacteroidales bacterium]|nr:D-amino-acid transaminase [Bacteroidales bacterium]
MPEIVYLNGFFLTKNKALISPDDRGFNFADGVYEVIRYYKGQPFLFDEHIRRLERSLNAVKIVFNDTHELQNIFNRLILENRLNNLYAGIYLQITRGSAKRTHHFPKENLQCTIYATAFEKKPMLKQLKTGIKVISRPDIRWLRCDIKSIALLPNTLIFQEAVEHGADECILIRQGNITEGTHSNAFAVKNNKVYTHPDGNLILSGITRIAVRKICSELNIELIEEPVKQHEIHNYSEFFLTGTGNEIMPVVQIDNYIFGNGIPGKITREIQRAFFKHTYEQLAGEIIGI